MHVSYSTPSSDTVQPCSSAVLLTTNCTARDSSTLRPTQLVGIGCKNCTAQSSSEHCNRVNGDRGCPDTSRIQDLGWHQAGRAYAAGKHDRLQNCHTQHPDTEPHRRRWRLKANASHAIVTNARKNKHSMPRLPHLDCPSKS